MNIPHAVNVQLQDHPDGRQPRESKNERADVPAVVYLLTTGRTRIDLRAIAGSVVTTPENSGGAEKRL
jgi:hypothetical protein